MMIFKKKLLYSLTLNLLCASSFIIPTSPAFPVITKQEETDLNIFQTDDNQSLLDILERTNTKVGRKFLEEMMRSPLTDRAELTKRQSLIKGFIENDALADKVKKELQNFKKYEAQLDLLLWQPEDKLCQTTLDDFYYQNTYFTHLNKSPGALNLLQIANVGNMFAPLIEHLALHFFISNTLAEKLHINCNHGHHHHGHNHDHDHHHDSEFTSTLLYKLYNAAHLAVHIFGIKQLYDHIKQKAALAKTVQTNLIAARRCLDSLKICIL